MSEEPIIEYRQLKRLLPSSTFRRALSRIPTHNFLNQAYHTANVHHMVPPYDLHWRISALLVPRKVRQSLQIDELVEKLRDSIARAREVIDEAKPYLDQEVTRRIHYSPDGPHPWVHESVSVARHFKEGYAPGWDYTFNGYELAVTLLDDYERYINNLVGGRLVPFSKVSRIHQRARRLEASIELVCSVMSTEEMMNLHRYMD